ncbi:DUF2267 domain-containing protein [Rhizobium glycinendophyticum]|uniref:DUF2267 domain-containing protein n=1 Tax=Rhizobium glycinendophyticum TaxID=2589807 RepID=A0A504U900_9HYPH|nr:DUF2267 domain-containing protein [Rhizobium glycinendophyticum]TPP11039.1 DUF2267 domain-containing protein [Rhizobium glycinendophyticum]
MPMPLEYRQASADFDRFMKDLVTTSMLTSSHQAYTMLQAVFYVFRRRLTVAEAIAFAGVLPPVLRAIFVSDWRPEEPQLPFVARDELQKEIRAFRYDHNLSTETAVEDVAESLKRHVDARAFQRLLAGFAPEARHFWKLHPA